MLPSSPLWVVVVAPVVYLFLSSVISFYRNLQAAKRTGLPFVVSPCDHLNPVWLILQKPLGPWLAKLPHGLGNFARWSTLDWFFKDKYRMHEDYGKTFINVTPGTNELHTIDPDVNAQIFTRRNDFEKSERFLKAVVLYGENVSSTAGSEWQRHRRMTTPPFNERNCRLVWDESLNQAAELAAYWSNRGALGISTITQDTLTASLNILATSALGRSWMFQGAEDSTSRRDEASDSADYRENLQTLLGNVHFLVMTPMWVYKLPLAVLPKALGNYVSAYRQFERYLVQMVKETRAEVAAGHINDKTFLDAIVSKSEEFQRQEKSSPDAAAVSGALTDSEIYGNLFTFNLAGHETTAGSLAFALHLLAINLEVQAWVREEVLSVYGQLQEGKSELLYEEAFPSMKRTLAVMLETLRLYCPVSSLNKCTNGRSQELVIAGRNVLIPPNWTISPNITATAMFPEYWGPDHMEWKPSRWIESDDESRGRGIEDALKAEKVGKPPKGAYSYFPWSAGPRVCPGKKFSQVQFVAVTAKLLRGHRIEVVPHQGESAAAARKRCHAMVLDSETRVTLQMRNPESVKLKLVRL